MPKPNSQQKNFEAIILGWPKKSWNSLKDSHKLEIWKEVFKKQTPDKLEIKHDFSDRYFDIAEAELERHEEAIFRSPKKR